jgi:hypothetical protein
MVRDTARGGAGQNRSPLEIERARPINFYLSVGAEETRDRWGRSETRWDRRDVSRRIILEQIEGVIGPAPLSALSPHFAGH